MVLLKRLTGFLVQLGTLPKAVLVQLFAAASIFGCIAFGLLEIEGLWSFAVLQSLTSLLFAFLMRSERWWFLIHALLPVALAGALLLNLNPNWYLLALCLVFLVFGPAVRTRVPLYLSSAAVAQAVAELIGKRPARVLDFGSGTGSFLRALARHLPGHRLEGIEGAFLPFLVSRLSVAGYKNVSIALGDFWKRPLSGYDVVYAFLSPAPMPRLWEKAARELKPGSMLISNSFEIPGKMPHAVIKVDDRRESRLFIYRF